MKSEKVNDLWLSKLAATLEMKLTRAQGQAVRLIVQECETQGVTDLRQIAYVLGTVYHECRFKSIQEIRAKPGTDVWKMQERYWHTGYYGRGFSQLTWIKNYKKFEAVVHMDLVKNPDLALLPEVGAKILVYGMKNGTFVANGMTSSIRLDTYFNESREDWFNARKIVNGTFRAEMVAEAAKKILPLLA
jgi:hypothetical protein